ncbi:unnamed protein product [Schistosoma curassoni]|uniref:Uncharacterized protein n=1 Tax=Schistosoma curassoni TaxID=6186 RepID=A0A183KUU6_9TREM|nr:unnamed protein product [Schistosoma curassoni]
MIHISEAKTCVLDPTGWARQGSGTNRDSRPSVSVLRVIESINKTLRHLTCNPPVTSEGETTTEDIRNGMKEGLTSTYRDVQGVNKCRHKKWIPIEMLDRIQRKEE